MHNLFFICSIWIISWSCFGQQIILDDSFDDWDNVEVKYTDPAGDVPYYNIDFTDVFISNDDRYLFLYLQLNREINIQENNNISLLIDIDNNENTGKKVNGIGAEIVYNFGKRQGFLYSGSNTYLIYHNHIGLVTAPTVTSDRFEIAIARNSFFNGISFAMQNQVSIVLSDESNNGDKAPDNHRGYAYVMDNNTHYTSSFNLERKDKNDLRIMTYNVLRDRLFNTGVRQNYNRIFNAVKPDIIGLCEIYDNSSAQVAALIEQFLPSSGGQKWYHASVNPDIRIVSRFPILNVRSIDGNGAFLIDLGKEKLVAIVAHLPCCNNETSRQQEVDNIMAFIRGIRFGISPFQVPINSPVIIMGDMNFVGLNQQLNTFLTGDIVNNNTYGPDFTPDWDYTNLEDLKPLTTGLPMTFTWNSNNGSYSAGRLDYMIYTGSVMQPTNGFVLWTPEMSQAELDLYGLRHNDVTQASDHAPAIGDFMLHDITSTTEAAAKQQFEFKQRDGQWIIASSISGRLLVSDVSGHVWLDIQKDDAGDQIIELPELSGLYILTFQTRQGIFSTKIFR